MQIAKVAAGFTDDEADGLRRAMATFRNGGTVAEWRTRMIEGMVTNGYARDFAERCYRQIEGFGSYGFPESHAISFALLVYVSAWLKCRYPAVFTCALLNSQPMGFYAPAQLVRDAVEHGVVIRPVDVQASIWDCTLEPCAGGFALRLGLRMVSGLSRAEGDALVAARQRGNGAPFTSVEDLARRVGLKRRSIQALARADAFHALGMQRREALWEASGVEPASLPLFACAEGDLLPEATPSLPQACAGEEVVEDYASLSLSLKGHPCRLLRPDLTALGLSDTRVLDRAANGSRIRLAGLVLMRQRPGSAKGVVFLTLEDEHGTANVVVFADVLRAFRPVVIGARMIEVTGIIERVIDAARPIVHVVAKRLEDRSAMLSVLHLRDGGDDRPLPSAPHAVRPGHYLPPSRDFH